MFTDRKEAV